MSPLHNETPPEEGDAHRISWSELREQDTKRTRPTEHRQAKARLRSLRSIGLPRSLDDIPELIEAWVRGGGIRRRHILGYVNEQGHVPPWVERQLRVAYEAVRGSKTRP